MALKHGSTHYTKWMHMENGQVMVRRIHRMEIQDAVGRLHAIEERDLPEAIVTSAGDRQQKRAIARILLRPRSRGFAEWESLELPSGVLVWNAFVFGLGFTSALALRFVARLLVDF